MPTDWNAIANSINEHADIGPETRKIDAKTVEELVTLYGWSVIGDLVGVYDQERQLRALVKSGVPFEEAIKLFGFREVTPPREI